MRGLQYIDEKSKVWKSARPIVLFCPQLASPALVGPSDDSGMSLFKAKEGHFEKFLRGKKSIFVDAKLFHPKSPQKHGELLSESQ